MAASWTVERFEDQPRRSILAGVGFHFVAGERVALTVAWFEKGSVLPSTTQRTHKHENEEILFIIRGELRMFLGDDLQEVVVRGGEAIVIPSWVPHGGDVIEDTYAIGAYSPIRPDFDSAEEVPTP